MLGRNNIVTLSRPWDNLLTISRNVMLDLNDLRTNYIINGIICLYFSQRAHNFTCTDLEDIVLAINND